jgi:hypothetical protein
MTTKTIPSTESIWSAVKSNLRNVNLPQVITSEEGERLIYYPKNSIYTGAGYKNINAQEYHVISPQGCKMSFTNLSAFCKEVFGVTENGKPKYQSSMSEMFSGKRKEDNVLGWRKWEQSEQEVA